MANPVTIRLATCQDAEACLAIYRPYITETAITSECSVPTVDEFAARIQKTLARYPWLVAERDGRIVGYAYASHFRTREAYDWSVELSIYVDLYERRGGVGGRLYARLEEILERMGIVNLYAWVAFPVVEDKYCTYDSYNFHAHLGYELNCVLKNSAYKFGRWFGLALMHKVVAHHAEFPERPVYLPDLEPEWK